MASLHDSRETRRTKIVGTLGPASNSEEVIEGLIRAGLDVARLNFSHGTHEDHRKNLARIRSAEARTQKPIAVLQDLQGPKIRLGKLDGEVFLKQGETAILSSDGDFLGTRDRLPTTYDRLSRDVKAGELIQLADGQLELLVRDVKEPDVICEVIVGGKLTSNKGMNLPGSNLSVPSLSQKDIADLEAGLAMGVDYVALSFVRTPHDVLELRALMEKLGRVVPIVSKIEKPQAVERLEAIVDVSEGLMVARGDLGVELPAEQVPAVQRRVIRAARERGKVTIVATQMLVSMTRHPRPTHAEVSDVANAVFDGTDAVMLSEETASGEYPIRAVETMAEILRSADGAQGQKIEPDFVASVKNSYPGAISRAAALLAKDMGAQAIIAFTDWGLGPRLIGNSRPRCDVIALAGRQDAVRRMGAYWGVRPLRIEAPSSMEGLLIEIDRIAVESMGLLPGSTVVVTSKMPFDADQVTSVMKLHKIGER
ncbi:MAG: pyruvate kinase [Myxococcota bacterium]